MKTSNEKNAQKKLLRTNVRAGMDMTGQETSTNVLDCRGDVYTKAALHKFEVDCWGYDY